MRRTTLIRLVFVLGLTAALFFGAMTVAPPPAYALDCGPTFLGCDFIGVQSFPGAICCMYLCPTGKIRRGLCEQTF